MKKLTGLLLVAALLGLSGCSTLHFVNEPANSNQVEYAQWHHNAAFSLYEVSSSVDPDEVCKGKAWSRVTTEETLLTGIAGSVDTVVGVDVWDPQMVYIKCAK